MTKAWFTADTHFGHAKIISHAKRPFKTVDEMDEALITAWNEQVKPTETIYHLGDFNYRSEKLTSWYLSRLNGHIHLIYGNHDDKFARKFARLFASVQEVKYLEMNNTKITLYHYAQRVWRNSHRGAWQLYGHSHSSLPNYHRSMDVGVDAVGYRPISFDEIKVYMDTQQVTNHHPELVSDPWDKS
jgi:calcineurin-like phosphoesterase family protein